MKLAIVILNWNGITLLKQFLPSVVDYSKEADIFVIDNQSTDDSIVYLTQYFPTVKVIQNKQNYGFAKGYNVGLQSIEADVFCLLNSDIEVTKDWLIPIISQYQRNPSTSIVQPCILSYHEPEKFEYAGAAGGFIDQYGYAFCRGRVFATTEKNHNQYQNSRIFWASGACMFIKKSDFTDLEGFDEDFFAHYEEIDLCWRAFNKNLNCYYLHESKVYHIGGATLSENNPQKTYLNFRNSLYTLVKNLPKKRLLPIVFTRMIFDGIAGIQFAVRGEFSHLFAVLKAHGAFYQNAYNMYLKRSKNQQKNYFETSNLLIQYFIKKHKTYTQIKTKN